MKKPNDLSLWLAVIGVFSLMIGAWIALFTIAARNPVQSVPLATPTRAVTATP